jgi:hypothetical protein
MKHILCTLALILGFSSAQAQELSTSNDLGTEAASPAWACSLAFQGHGGGLKVIVGRYKFDGTGTMKCTSANGKHASYNVNITMRTGLITPGISIGKFEMKGRSADISVFDRDPRSILGDYYIAQGQGAIVAGAGVITAAKVGTPALNLKISVQFVTGGGINLSLNKMNISLAD